MRAPTAKILATLIAPALLSPPGPCPAAVSVQEVGAQLKAVQQISQNVAQIRQMNEQYIVPAVTNIRENVDLRIEPNIQRLRNIAEGQNNAAAAMAKRIMLERYAAILQKHPNGRETVEPAYGRTFDGTSFSGGDLGNIDAVVGINGVPVSMDRQLPVSVVPVSAAHLPALQSYQGSMGSSLTQLLNSFLPFNVRNSSLSSLISQMLGRLGGSMMGNGIFMRDYAGRADDGYAYSYGQTDPLLRMAYWASRQASGYDPLMGVVGDPAMTAGGMFNDALTRGQYRAVDQYLRANGMDAAANPYSTFSGDIVGTALQQARATRVGERLAVTPEQVEAYRGGSGQPVPEQYNIESAPALDFGAAAAGAPGASASAGSKVLSVTLPVEGASTYGASIQASDAQLTGVQQRLDKIELVIKWTHQEIGELQELHKQADVLRAEIGKLDQGAKASAGGAQSAGAGGGAKGDPPSHLRDPGILEAIPQITQVCLELLGMISERENRIMAMEAEAQRLTEVRFALLKERQDIVNAAWQTLQANGDNRTSSLLADALLRQGATTATAP